MLMSMALPSAELITMSDDLKDLGKFASALPGSSREGAKTPLGYACLSTIALCFLAYMLFGNSPDTVKIVIFVAILISALFFFCGGSLH